MDHRISAGTIVEDGGRLLLVRHVVPGKYDFWVCPGGGAKGFESLEQAAAREAKEETGLDVQVGKLVYVEEFANPQTRFVKFWFLGRVLGGSIDTSHPETVHEHIVEAGWVSLAELRHKTVYPGVITTRFAQDLEAGFPELVRLPLHPMEVW